MKIGTKTLLFGCHQFILHPLFTLIAWVVLYKKVPKLYQLCAIVVHDWGYWGCCDIDGKEGELHPEKLYKFFNNFGLKKDKMYSPYRLPKLNIFAWMIYDQIRRHSDSYIDYYFRKYQTVYSSTEDKIDIDIKESRLSKSKLFYADKLAFVLMPNLLILILGNLSGEIKEYIEHCKNGKYLQCGYTNLNSQLLWLIETKALITKRILKND